MGMGMGYVEVVYVSESVTVVGPRLRRSGSIGSLVDKCIWAVLLEEVEPHY